MTLTLQDFVSIGVLVAILQALAAALLNARVNGSIGLHYDKLLQNIKHEHDRQLEELRSQIRMREQAAGVAKLLAEWAYRPLDTDRTLLNELAWGLSLWLPSILVKDLTKCLCKAPGAKDIKEVLIDVRRHIRNDSNDDLKADNIVHFLPPGNTTTSLQM